MRLIIFLSLITFILSDCNQSISDPGKKIKLDPDAEIWMAIDPIQCMRNPWEQDWLAVHGGDPTGYPTDLADQVPIIRDYYEGQGIEILDIKAAVTYTDVCYTCDCPDGYTVWMKVETRDANALTDMGFRVEDPPDDV
jgi:hypothetical protein